ncbi:hypothetical protein [Streptomyces sp. NPDC058335]|uniref:hypothetical protein n=1 Tax=Streptomyces sp. NPDC058335 TaxID=3346451 RepID=UPI003669694F
MNSLSTAQAGGTSLSSVVNQQVTAVMPLWRAAEIFGLNPAPAAGEACGHGMDRVSGALR